MMKYFIILFFFLLPTEIAYSQFYEFGQDPGSLKWKRIDTEHFRVLFPEDFGNTSQTLATMMEAQYKPNSAGLSHEPSKIPIIIHNQSVYSNAFVTWAPKRMEFFTFPSPDMFPMDWLNELSLHEFRHVIQIDKTNQGFTKFLSFMLGQQATGFVAGMMPLWFIEGDAVTAETNLSQSGRGRLPSFEMEMKANLLSNERDYSFSKAYLGSYRDFVPDYYSLGFQMVSYAREKYGEDYWTNALEYISRRPFLISPYYFYSRKVSGGGQSLLYQGTNSYLKNHWKENMNDRNPSNENTLNQRQSNTYTSYSQPLILSDSLVLCLKSGLNIIPHFTILNSRGEEEIIFTPGSLVSGRFSVNNKNIVWDENVQDLRWKNRIYSVLKIYNFETGKRKKITKKSRVFSPSWSIGGDSIIALSNGTDYSNSLLIIRPSDGKILKKISSLNNSYLQTPVFIEKSGRIAVIASGSKGKEILIYDLNTSAWTSIFKSGHVNIDQLKSSGTFLFFCAGFNGIDNIYSYNISDKKLRNHSNSRFGAFSPDVSSDMRYLTYSSYSSNGYDIVLKEFNPQNDPVYIWPDTIKEQSFVSVGKSPEIEETFKTGQIFQYPVKPYSKVSHLFNLHSWAPYWFNYMDPNIHDPKVKPGITLISQNDLSTAFSIIGYERNNGVNYFHTGFTYKGLFPVIDLSATYGGAPIVAKIKNVTTPIVNTNLNSNVSVYLPLVLSSGKFITGMQPSIQFTYNSTYFYYYADQAYKRGVEFVEPRLYMYSYQRTSIRDLQPRMGFTLDTRISTAPFENEIYGNIRSLNMNFYLPGIIKNQGIRLKGEWQNQKVDSYYFPNILAMPRGYSPRTFIKMNKYSADYIFPILYPDLSIGSIFYLKRFRGDMFVDYMDGIEKYLDAVNTSPPEHLLSQGIEIFADYHIFRFIIELTSGIRIIYLPHQNVYSTQVLFNLNLNKF